MSLLPLFLCIAVVEVSAFPNRRPINYTICETDACHTVGQMIQRGINYSSDPCDNFYNYGCGSWAANNPMPPSALYWNTDKVYIMKINRRLKELLEERSKHDKLPPIRKLKQYYRSCMDEDAIEKEGLEPMMTMLDATGGWPIIMENEGTNLENYTWQDIDNAYIPIFGFSSFVDISYEPDDENSNYNILMINIDKISLTENKLYSERVLFSNPDLTKMEEIIKAFAKYKGAKINTNRMDKEIEDLFLFEEKFKDIIRKSYENVFKGLEINRTKMTISELQEYYDLAKTENTTSKINWLQTLQSVYNSVNVSINASEPVNVYNKKLLHKLAYLLDATSPRILVNFVQWDIVRKLVPFLTKSVRDIDFKSTHEKYNVTEQKPRWETCVQEIPFQNALSYLYVKNYNITHNIKAVIEMIEEIKTELKKHTLHSKWMDNNTKEFIVSKIDNLVQLIGHPEWYNNQTALIKRYEGFQIGQNYFKNVLTVVIYELRRFLKEFRKPVNKYEWFYFPLDKNSYYDQSNVPISEIQDPYFAPGMPLAFNYGSVGTVIGHELTHSFDTTGMQHDKFGNKYSQHSKKMNEAYKERLKCFVDQYNNFTIIRTDGYEERVNGLLTRNENVADNTGLEIAFATFKRLLLTAGPQPKLPGLTNVTDEQLFFLSYINAWCGTSRNFYEEDYINNDVHTFPRFRTIGSASNFVSFSKVYNCSVNSPMNRQSKCNLWK
ncbi:endothelin-converting enzyme 1-like isoform X2 [Harpegnathos saltator]|uniref:endothelin-converting enzyme 1-like isoform X2 n=1 Tax=Harpegnathos saltator TaxID=610380 RepID=UPI000DBEE317|nr:endothelin-converting enzyme 1-like isoform X2 [Harpegnathos saltator]